MMLDAARKAESFKGDPKAAFAQIAADHRRQVQESGAASTANS
jgi:hypothetical protein